MSHRYLTCISIVSHMNTHTKLKPEMGITFLNLHICLSKFHCYSSISSKIDAEMIDTYLILDNL